MIHQIEKEETFDLIYQKIYNSHTHQESLIPDLKYQMRVIPDVCDCCQRFLMCMTLTPLHTHTPPYTHTHTQKLSDDLWNEKEETFDISKIPDVYDCCKYDAIHTQVLGVYVCVHVYVCVCVCVCVCV